MGLGKFVRRGGAGDEVISGGSGGWLGFEDGEVTTGGEVAGDELAVMISVIMGRVSERWRKPTM